MLALIKKIINNKLILSIAIITQLVLLYSLTYWGYQTSRLPYWFDNFVQEYGIWQLYGVKNYDKEPDSDKYWFDPRLRFTQKSLILHKHDGYIETLDTGSDTVKMHLVSNMNEEEETVSFAKSDLKLVCIDSVCLDKTLEDVMVSDYVYFYMFDYENKGEQHVYLIVEKLNL